MVETIWETIKFIDRIKPGDVGYYIATPYPGTPLYDQVVKEVLLNDTVINRRWIKHSEIADGGILRFVMSQSPIENNYELLLR